MKIEEKEKHVINSKEKLNDSDIAKIIHKKKLKKIVEKNDKLNIKQEYQLILQFTRRSENLSHEVCYNAAPLKASFRASQELSQSEYVQKHMAQQMGIDLLRLSQSADVGVFGGVYNYITGKQQVIHDPKVALKQKIQETNDLRIQGVVHTLAMFLCLVQRYTEVCMPFQISLENRGYRIRHSGTGYKYPLFILPKLDF